ncbi:hypothetical protein HUT19_34385 [Streptomyces sp. NA02950]|nr:hypothetical protein [Streptomyces sp. NA02950]QKV90360.1 hypothetical protein HUT19_34385 [Streptomyces sp. NA02950]
MKFLAITLIVHAPDPVTGVQKPTHARFREVNIPRGHDGSGLLRRFGRGG